MKVHRISARGAIVYFAKLPNGACSLEIHREEKKDGEIASIKILSCLLDTASAHELAAAIQSELGG